MARTRFDPSADAPFAVSRSKLELFLECPRCFYLDRCRGVTRPDTAYYSLNLAVDHLLKKEFDAYRIDQKPHPVMELHGIEAVPFKHPQLSAWRDTPNGIRHAHPCGIELFGIVDDVWRADDGALHPVDYKATSAYGIPTLEARDGYKRQLDVYGWLLKKNGFDLAREGYVVFANADREREGFDRSLHFGLSVAVHALDLGWIDEALQAVRECLERDVPPPSTNGCAWCAYRRNARASEA
jgi:hypothetical protein